MLFGHMHSVLKGGGQRNMAHVDPGTGTVLLNCAGGMNNKAISDDFRIKLAMPISC